mmetsp:Transcript_7819/g.12882  ORF Transcript_7819/g.12882 Transcript_7819/m.12882 type:complete len:157 (+) Transcript_7819:222-692(+)
MCNSRSTTTTNLFSKTDQSSPSADGSSSSSCKSEAMQTATAPCAPEPIEIDISRFSAEKLQSLKQDDPFLYYSIPAVRRATFNLSEHDMSDASLEEQTTVKRRTRVSFECHTDLLLDDLMEDFEDEDFDESELKQIDREFFELLGLAYGDSSKTLE